jgi:RIO kinase 1
MHRNTVIDDLDELQGAARLPRIKNISHQEQRLAHSQAKRSPHPGHKPKVNAAEAQAEIAAQADDQGGFDFTYTASRYEGVWLLESLGGMVEERWIADVLRMIKGGKEASVYQCRGGPATGLEWIAAKVYRPRRFRQLKNDHVYKEGRDRLDIGGHVINDDRMHHAMNKRTGYGLELLHTSWIAHEFKALQDLHAAGADVPEPYASGHNAILMEYIGDEDTPAPTLNSLELERGEARRLFERVLHNLELMLAHGRVHADLSAYNILYWQGEIWLIDFPQAFPPEANKNGFQIFRRDVTRICEYFISQGVRCKPQKIAEGLWTANGLRLAPEIQPQYLDDQSEQDRALWRKAQTASKSASR